MGERKVTADERTQFVEDIIFKDHKARNINADKFSTVQKEYGGVTWREFETWSRWAWSQWVRHKTKGTAKRMKSVAVKTEEHAKLETKSQMFARDIPRPATPQLTTANQPVTPSLSTPMRALSIGTPGRSITPTRRGIKRQHDAVWSPTPRSKKARMAVVFKAYLEQQLELGVVNPDEVIEIATAYKSTQDTERGESMELDVDNLEIGEADLEIGDTPGTSMRCHHPAEIPETPTLPPSSAQQTTPATPPQGVNTTAETILPSLSDTHKTRPRKDGKSACSLEPSPIPRTRSVAKSNPVVSSPSQVSQPSTPVKKGSLSQQSAASASKSATKASKAKDVSNPSTLKEPTVPDHTRAPIIIKVPELTKDFLQSPHSLWTDSASSWSQSDSSDEEEDEEDEESFELYEDDPKNEEETGGDKKSDEHTVDEEDELEDPELDEMIAQGDPNRMVMDPNIIAPDGFGSEDEGDEDDVVEIPRGTPQPEEEFGVVLTDSNIETGRKRLYDPRILVNAMLIMFAGQLHAPLEKKWSTNIFEPHFIKTLSPCSNCQ